ncbi:ATPase [bacterium]|nr:MAG: ATPase [bacterium]
MERRVAARDISSLVALAVLMAAFGLMSPEFLAPRNLAMLSIELSTTAVLALGMFLVILCGHIDLSAGSGVGLVGGVASVLVFQHHWPAPAAMALAAVVGVAVWTAMGALVVRQKMPAFIITLGGLLMFKGLFWMVIRNSTVPIVEGGGTNLYSMLTTYYLPPAAGWALGGAALALLAFALRGRLTGAPEEREGALLELLAVGQAGALFILLMNRYRGIPLPVLVLGAATAVVVTLAERTPFGRHLYAIGGNEEAAALSGVPVDARVIAAFGLMGAIVAVTGFMQTAYAGASTTTVGELMELDAVAACVIGGTSLKGGRGSALRVLVGSLIMAVLLNGMTLMAVSPEVKLVARGLVLTLAVWLDTKLGANSR